MINCVKGLFKVYINSTCILTIVTGFLYSIGDINQSMISWQFVSKSILLLEMQIIYLWTTIESFMNYLFNKFSNVWDKGYWPLVIIIQISSFLEECNDIGKFQKIWKSTSRVLMHGLAVYVKEGLPFAWDVSLENSADSYVCFWLTLPHSVSYMFFLCQSPSLSLGTIFDSIWSNTDDFLCINPSANVFVFGDFNIHHKNWLTYSGGTGWWTGSLAFIYFFWH